MGRNGHGQRGVPPIVELVALPPAPEGAATTAGVNRKGKSCALFTPDECSVHLYPWDHVLVHAVLIVQVKPSASDAELIAGLSIGFGPSNMSDRTRARELSARWSKRLLYGQEASTFAVFCIRNVNDRLQFHLEPGSDDIWQTTETTWSQLRRHLEKWKPKLISARVEDGRTNEVVLNGYWRSRVHDIGATDLAVVLVGIASIGLAVSGAATIGDEVPAYISALIVGSAVVIRLLHKKIVWRAP